PLHKSTQQVRTQGPIRHADCRQRKLADFLCTGGIIQEPKARYGMRTAGRENWPIFSALEG
ncbi:hypothetical protein F9B02_11385, partial [Escherichia coli]|nr:hypothetical protein [Escherichia coli]